MNLGSVLFLSRHPLLSWRERCLRPVGRVRYPYLASGSAGKPLLPVFERVGVVPEDYMRPLVDGNRRAA